MHSLTRRRAADQRGITVVEILVVVALLGIVGAIVASSMVRGFQADAEARDRITAFEDMQVALERMSREIRGANPLLLAEDDQIEVQVLRDGQCLHFRYRLPDGEEDVLVRQRRSTDGCNTFTDLAEQPLMQGLEGGPIFEYRDRHGQVLDPDEGPIVGDVRTVRITFQRSLIRDRQVEVNTIVQLRNS